MLYREIIAVCSEIHTKHINTLCGQNVELLNVKLVVHIVTTGLWRVKRFYCISQIVFMFLLRICQQTAIISHPEKFKRLDIKTKKRRVFCEARTELWNARKSRATFQADAI